jgi:hypothetical protein
MAKQTTDVAVRELSLDEVADALLTMAEVQAVSSDQMQADMVQRILESGSLEEAFADFNATPAADVEGIKLAVNGIAWVKSAFEQGAPVYGLFRCHLIESGEDVVVSMGGRTLCASFVWAQRNMAMPITGTFRAEPSKTNPEFKFWTFKLASPPLRA